MLGRRLVALLFSSALIRDKSLIDFQFNAPLQTLNSNSELFHYLRTKILFYGREKEKRTKYHVARRGGERHLLESCN